VFIVIDKGSSAIRFWFLSALETKRLIIGETIKPILLKMIWTLLLLDKFEFFPMAPCRSSRVAFMPWILEMLVLAAVAHIGVFAIQADPVCLSRHFSCAQLACLSAMSSQSASFILPDFVDLI